MQCKIFWEIAEKNLAPISIFLPQKVHEWRVHVTSALLLYSRDPFNDVKKRRWERGPRRIGRSPWKCLATSQDLRARVRSSSAHNAASESTFPNGLNVWTGAGF